MDYSIERAIERDELYSQEHLAYVSDIYKFLTIVVPCYVIGLLLPTYYNIFSNINHHWFFITSLLTLILTFEGKFGILFGSISAICFGIVWSDYLPLDPNTTFIIGCASVIIFGSATICSRMIQLKQLIINGTLVVTIFQLCLLLLLTNTYHRIDLILYLIVMTYYVYYNMNVAFNLAKSHVTYETSIKRNTFIVIDAFSILLLGLFMRNN